MLYVYRFLRPPRLGWLLVCYLYKEVYLQFFKRVSFWLHGCCGEWEGWARKQVNHTSWVAIFTPTDRPKSFRNRSVIELFVALFVLSLCPFDISVGVAAFVIGLSQISSFFLLDELSAICLRWFHLHDQHFDSSLHILKVLFQTHSGKNSISEKCKLNLFTDLCQ